jgi:hypothetical protein
MLGNALNFIWKSKYEELDGGSAPFLADVPGKTCLIPATQSLESDYGLNPAG